MAMVHHLLSQIPQDLPYETLISRAGDLFVQFPPSELAREASSHDWYLNFDLERYILTLTVVLYQGFRLLASCLSTSSLVVTEVTVHVCFSVRDLMLCKIKSS